MENTFADSVVMKKDWYCCFDETLSMATNTDGSVTSHLPVISLELENPVCLQNMPVEKKIRRCMVFKGGFYRTGRDSKRRLFMAGKIFPERI